MKRLADYIIKSESSPNDENIFLEQTYLVNHAFSINIKMY